ncbi:sigma factor [Nonomuraea aurantiaca]|uniref:sigma factor n=1 Tax=Nonomuraea aurantiaca TaxID=2878562 RepID=UPI001CDA084D|nr:sigma factor [Nonomuraea aurantiaca]MCA2220483.1 hypothetical protein [Nonomuraea aurantiaca]
MDRDASFQAVVDAHQRSLMRLAYLLTGEVHLAEDLVQSVLVRMIGRQALRSAPIPPGWT